MIQFGGNFILYGLMFADIGAGYTIIVSPFYVFFSTFFVNVSFIQFMVNLGIVCYHRISRESRRLHYALLFSPSWMFQTALDKYRVFSSENYHQISHLKKLFLSQRNSFFILFVNLLLIFNLLFPSFIEHDDEKSQHEARK